MHKYKYTEIITGYRSFYDYIFRKITTVETVYYIGKDDDISVHVFNFINLKATFFKSTDSLYIEKVEKRRKKEVSFLEE